MSGRIRIVGLGSPDGGDDRIGWEVVEWLRPRLPSSIEVFKDGGGGARIDAWCVGTGALFLLDAARMAPGLPPGTHLRLTYPEDRERLLAGRVGGTHGYGVVQALDLLRAVGQLPRWVRIHALVGCEFEWRAPLSDVVASALESFGEAVRLEAIEWLARECR